MKVRTGRDHAYSRSERREPASQEANSASGQTRLAAAPRPAASAERVGSYEAARLRQDLQSRRRSAASLNTGFAT
jgi:hypothetical protein